MPDPFHFPARPLEAHAKSIDAGGSSKDEQTNKTVAADEAVEAGPRRQQPLMLELLPVLQQWLLWKQLWLAKAP